MEKTKIRQVLDKVDETKEVIVGFGVLEKSANEYLTNFPGRQAVLVADENTYLAAGKAVHDQFQKAKLLACDPIILPGKPMLYANFDNVLRLEEQLRHIDAVPVAVGSGTINDLTKLASQHLGRQYMVIGTAASMDGYTASGASISKDGFKQTFSCAAPRVVLADLDIIMHAPDSMTSSGYGDLLAKIMAGADWIIADGLGVESIDPDTWEIVQGPLRESIGFPEKLAQKDREAFQTFVIGLMMSGLSLQYYKGSRPASGAEHLISHLWEMQETTHGDVSHGLKVGLGTLASSALYQKLLEQDFSNLDIDKALAKYPTLDEFFPIINSIHPDRAVVDSSIEQFTAKYGNRDKLASRLKRLKENWPDMKQRLTGQLFTAERTCEMLAAAGCITRPDQIGKNSDDLRMAYRNARLIRNRYTVLDLAAETGCLESCLNELFSRGGFWGERI